MVTTKATPKKKRTYTKKKKRISIRNVYSPDSYKRGKVYDRFGGKRCP
jgi:hypothetical protein